MDRAKEKFGSLRDRGVRSVRSGDQRTEAKVKSEGSRVPRYQGTLTIILGMVESNEQVRGQVQKDIKDMAAMGYRALGVARQDEGKWRLLGVVALPRSSSTGFRGDRP